jgi:hypothetical protein
LGVRDVPRIHDRLAEASHTDYVLITIGAAAPVRAALADPLFIAVCLSKMQSP